MHLAVGRLTLHLPNSHSLKSRRQTAQSLTARIRSRFNVTVAQDAGDNLWQQLTLLVCAASGDGSYANKVLEQVATFVAKERPDLELVSCEVEVISGL